MERRRSTRVGATDIVDWAHALCGYDTITSYTGEVVNGNVAATTYELTDPTLDPTYERWLFEGDAWRNDDC